MIVDYIGVFRDLQRALAIYGSASGGGIQEGDTPVKDKEALRQALEDAKRRSELGSQELQGEVLELDIQAALEQQFPQDRIEPVVKGARGADIIQAVRNERLQHLLEIEQTRLAVD